MRADRFLHIYAWIGIAGGLVFILFGAWALWIAQSSVLLVLGLMTLVGSVALRRKHERLRVSEGREEAGPPLAQG